MIRQKIENRAQNRRLTQTGAQFLRRQASQPQKTLGSWAVRQHPAKGLKGQCGCIRRGSGFANDCQGLSRAIWVVLKAAKPCRPGTRLSVAKRILVVEDNDLNRKLFCDLLRANGFEVEPVSDGREAIAKTRQFMPDLVIMDIQLPEVSGMDLITAIKADDDLKAIPILAVTAYAGKGDEDSIRDAGAEGYLAKPVSIGPFMVAVNKLV